MLGGEVTTQLSGRVVEVENLANGRVRLTIDVTATERIQVQATGSVQGDVHAPRLSVLDGAVVHGKVDVAGTRSSGPTG